MGKKITQLATITEIADDDLLVGVDISDTSGSAEGTNKKFTKANLLSGLAPLAPQLTGWNPDTETWVYHSVDDPTGYIKIEDKDVSANYSVGYRIMFTNGGNVIKGIITAITYSDPDTIITFLHEIDPTDNQALYLLTNSAITENYFSPHKAPYGFPLDPNKWTVKGTAGAGTQNTPSANTWYNINSNQISIPIGAWRVMYKIGIYTERASSAFNSQLTTLSTADNNQSDGDFTTIQWSAGTHAIGINQTEKILTLASKTVYYMNHETTYTSASSIMTDPIITGYLKAICAYL